MKIKSFRRHDQEFRTIKNRGFFKYIGAILLWLVLGFLFLFGLYVEFFREKLSLILYTWFKIQVQIPFWVALLCVIFLFPFTLVIVLLGLLI